MLLTFNRTDFAYLPFLEVTSPPLLVLTILLALMLISTYPMI